MVVSGYEHDFLPKLIIPWDNRQLWKQSDMGITKGAKMEGCLGKG